MANEKPVADLPATSGSEIKGDTTKEVVKQSESVTQYSPRKKTEREIKEAEWRWVEKEKVGAGNRAEPEIKAESARQQPLQPQKPRKSVSEYIKDLSEAPRRAKERAEEMGEAAEKKYRETREKPAEAAAYRTYQDRMQEANTKFQEGKISKELYESRKAKYKQAYEAEKAPLEKRLVRGAIDIGTNLQRGAVGETTSQKAERKYKEKVQEITFEFSKGHLTEKQREQKLGEAARTYEMGRFNLSRGVTKNVFEGGGVLGKVAATYRPSPVPRIKPGRGTSGRLTSSSGKGFSPIDFGSLSGGKKGSSGIDFSRASLFGGSGKSGSFTGIDFSSPLFKRKK